ncbi:hypothetical protein FRB93_005589 [Tulasnella sp. JGI-2019a]|nr:hypothetical protein FRB93_005589 [Tulasnella sp. JGI-2019a]
MEYAPLEKIAKAPHVVDAQEMCEDPTRGICSIIIRYVRGVALANWKCRNEERIWRTSTCVSLGFQLFPGIVQIQNHSIIHADIKPENVMTNQDGHVICDFGIGAAALVPGGTRRPFCTGRLCCGHALHVLEP